MQNLKQNKTLGRDTNTPKLWIALTLTVLVLTACSNLPTSSAPNYVDATENRAQVLGVGTFDMKNGTFANDSLTVQQELVPGLDVALLSDQFVDMNGMRNRTITYEITNNRPEAIQRLVLYSLESSRTFAGTNVFLVSVRDAAGTVLNDASVATSINFMNAETAPADAQAVVDALLRAQYPSNTSLRTLTERFSTTLLSDSSIIEPGASAMLTLIVQYPYNPASPTGEIGNFNLLFAFVNELVPTLASNTIIFDMEAVTVIAPDPAIAVNIAPNVAGPEVTVP